MTPRFLSTKLHACLFAAFGGLAGFADTASAQSDETVIQRVEVTGSSLRRVDAETTVPVQTITRAEIDTLGVTNAEELLNKVTAISQVGATTTAQGAGVATYGEATASLRGLGSSRTLILVNGRRVANYATDGTSVDINSIPLAAVERVEVLKDGASGLYGSDAIAGVINFILRKDVKGVELSAYFGSPTTAGGGKSTKGSMLFGFGDLDKDGFNVMASLDAAKDSAIYGRQRSYANRAWDNGGAFDVSATPSGALTTYSPGATPHDPLLSNGTSLGNPLASPNNCAANGSAFDANLGTCRFNSSPFVPLLPDVSRVNGQLSVQSRVNDDNTFFAEGFLSNTKTVTTEQPSPYSNSFLSTDAAFQAQGINPSIVLNPTNAAYPLAYLQAYDTAHGTNIAGTPVSVSYRAFDGGERVHTDNATQLHIATGLEGTLHDTDYKIAYAHNSSQVSESTQSGYQSQTALVSLLSGNDAFNPFVANQTPALAAQIAATNYIGNIVTSTLSTDSIDGQVSRDLYKLPGGQLTGAVGFSFRKEKLDFSPSAAYISGDVSGYGGQVAPLQAQRNAHSFFAEVDAPLLKSLDADFQVRNDHYPNASATTPKISLKFTPIQQVAVRGSFGKGFREPSLPELYSQQTLGTSVSFEDPVTKQVGQFNVLAGGNPNLSPEKSRQFSLGLVLQPVKNLSATIDYFHIKIDKLVTTLDPEFIVDQAAAGNSQYTDLVTRDADGNITKITSTNLNVGGVMTSGVDVDVDWKSDKSSWGQFGVNLSGTYTAKYDETLPDGTVQHSVGKTITADGSAINAVSAGGILFKWRHTLAGSWSYGPATLTLSQNYQSSYNDAARADSTTGTDAQHVKAFQTFDLQGAYSGVKGVTLRLGVKNLTDRQPPQSIGLGQYFQIGYDPSYYDPHGRFVYGSASYKF